MRRVLGLCLMLMASTSYATELQMRSEGECNYAADMVLTALAGRQSNVSESTLRNMMQRMYFATDPKKWQPVLDAVLSYTRNSKVVAQDANSHAQVVNMMCVLTQGDLSQALGIKPDTSKPAVKS